LATQESQTKKPIWPGMTGGAFKPLSNRDIERIHHTALDVLEKIGIANPTPELLEYALPKGCILDEDIHIRAEAYRTHYLYV